MAEDDLEQRLRKGRLVREAETIHIEGVGKSSTGEVREFAHPDAIEAADRLKRYRKALEWYADREKWSDADSFYGNAVEWDDGNRCDYGERARQALQNEVKG